MKALPEKLNQYADLLDAEFEQLLAGSEARRRCSGLGGNDLFSRSYQLPENSIASRRASLNLVCSQSPRCASHNNKKA